MIKDKLERYPASERFRDGFRTLDSNRHYSLLTYVMFFFSFSIVGWLWEVGILIYQTGEFVNRGVLFGPWLPIYGVGGVAIVFLFHRFAERPVVAFFSSMILCSVVEYFTSWLLELMCGTRWWDYSGYTLNLNGRICLLGAVIFGFAGVAGIYILGPFLDNVYKKIKHSIRVLICIILAILFVVDLFYSYENPHKGEGITTTTMINDTKSVSINL